MNEILSAVNATLLPLSAVYLYYFVKYQINTRNNEKPQDVYMYGWSVCCVAAGTLVLSILFFLYDFDVIYRSTAIKIGLIPRSLFVGGMLLAYCALDIPWKRTVILVSSAIGVLVFILRVCF